MNENSTLYTETKSTQTAESITSLKLEINNLIWMYSPKDLQLEDAEQRAVHILNLITQEADNTKGGKGV